MVALAVGTHVLSCNGIEVGFATYRAIDVSLLFDHGKSVAGASGA